MQNSCAENLREMQDIHIGWNFGDIGFNFVIGNDGNVFEGNVVPEHLLAIVLKSSIFKVLDGTLVEHILQVIIYSNLFRP